MEGGREGEMEGEKRIRLVIGRARSEKGRQRMRTFIQRKTPERGKKRGGERGDCSFL